MSKTFDVIVIGSGFGGAITACRLAEKGMTVLVLERGRRWSTADFPRKVGDPWLYNNHHPDKQNGWLDLRFFNHMTVAQAAGVGGGSLAYSSVALEAHASLFAEGWPAEITPGELSRHYARVAQMMNLQTVPDGQLTQRFKLAREAAQALGYGDRTAKVPLAVSFSPEWNYQLDDPHHPKHSQTFTNAQGQQQGTCIHLGNCDIGCDVRAKNTLDLNYIPLAERHGADVRPLHMVRSIEPHDGGYRVIFDRIENGHFVRDDAQAARVIVAAGSLGSTELLLRTRDEHRTLPNISRLLGADWSANANVLSMATYDDPTRVQQTRGPSISGVVDFLDASVDGERFVIEDDGFPNVLLNALKASLDAGEADDAGRSIVERIAEFVRGDERSRNVMVWLGAGMDAADGELSLERNLLSRARTLTLKWKPEQSRAVVEAIMTMHRRMTEATEGHLQPNSGWRLFKNLVTLHPLGGCRMGTDANTGVVNHLGQVFGYPRLYVADGAILPTAVGRNPSHTIAALAERIASQID